MAFRELANRLDATVFSHLGDPASLNGRTVTGLFAAPWRQPTYGGHNTCLREPVLTVREADAEGLEQGALITLHLPAPDGGDYDFVRPEPDGTGLVVLVLRRCV
ncbi:head-tail joining protein [Pseudomonas nitroreducens]|uniref:head-tail joining protein n=1 Tax=Pseudomonas nitroreducens TaxID=46680 RepID=UPI0002F00B15|nr:hypothetical protein [Pseudomonas nitroreducens]